MNCLCYRNDEVIMSIFSALAVIDFRYELSLRDCKLQSNFPKFVNHNDFKWWVFVDFNWFINDIVFIWVKQYHSIYWIWFETIWQQCLLKSVSGSPWNSVTMRRLSSRNKSYIFLHEIVRTGYISVCNKIIRNQLPLWITLERAIPPIPTASWRDFLIEREHYPGLC